MTPTTDNVEVRAVLRLAAEHVRGGPPRDYGPGRSVHDAFADAVHEILDQLDDPVVAACLRLLASAEREARP